MFMNNYSYLMNRSGYRSFMDAPGKTQSIPAAGNVGRTIITETEPVQPTIGGPMSVSHQALPPRPMTPAGEPVPETQKETERVAVREETTPPATPMPRPAIPQMPQPDNTAPNAEEDRAISAPDTEMIRMAQEKGIQMRRTGIPTDSMNDITGLPEILTNPVFMSGYLRTQIGKPTHVEFSVGDTMAERTGVLMQVGADYIVLAIPDENMHTVCSNAHIKSITILEQSTGENRT